MKNQKGFTMIELLLTISIIAILYAMVVFIIDPETRFQETRNAERSVEIHTILNAIHQYRVDNNGNLPTTITQTQTEICKTNALDCTGLIDLSILTTNEEYLVDIPLDPSGVCDPNGVCYEIKKSGNSGRITVIAPDAEAGETISVKR
ncbi:MAG: type II secretion system GspH family protein [Candidatus Magasanikbacteria bacterium]|nr:type II secretion system GspH family protein [Candidatus Magasanikbacteria bacterium]